MSNTTTWYRVKCTHRTTGHTTLMRPLLSYDNATKAAATASAVNPSCEYSVVEGTAEGMIIPTGRYFD